MIEVVPVAPRMGAEVRGLRLNTVGDEEFARVYDAFLAHNVLVIRDQSFTIEEFLAYSRRFGAVRPHRVRRTRHPAYPELTVMGVDAVKADGKVDDAIHKRGAAWHTDSPYETPPGKATQLYAVEMPTHGGDTLFANMYSAYDALPQRLKDRIAGLQCRFRYGGVARVGHQLLDEAERLRPAEAVHPLARVHPETGRTSLYVNPVHALEVVGLPPPDSEALLAELYGYMVQPDAQYRHQWRNGDVVIWDNRCSIHAATGDHPPDQKRIHWRCTIMDPAALGADPPAPAAVPERIGA